jgi:serine/threonine protein kinase
MLVWPDDLNEIKITRKEAREIEEVAKYFRRILMPDTAEKFPAELVKRGRLFKSAGGGKFKLSRTLYITNRAAVVILNTHGGMPALKGGDCQTHIKFAWDLIKAELCVKKSSRSEFERTLYQWIKYSRVAKPTGFPRITGFYETRGKIKILEKYYPVSLNRHLKSKPELNFESILKFINTLIHLHQFTYTPPTLSWDAGFKTLIFTSFRGGPVFHGNLSPDNIMVDEEGSLPVYRIISFGSAAEFSRVAWTPGWGSPETIRFSQGKLSMKESEFNAKYGQAKDIWALGLLVGSILRKRLRNSCQKNPIPRFSFIAKKLKIIDGRIDDSKIAELKQRKIDRKINSIIRKIKKKYAAEKDFKNNLIKIWTFVKRCLKVDPEERFKT